MKLPYPELGKSQNETVDNLYDTVIKLRKELEYTLYNLDSTNVPHLTDLDKQNVITASDIAGNKAAIITNANNISLIATDVSGHTSQISVMAGQISAHTSDIAGNTSAIIVNANSISLVSSTVSGHTSSLSVQAGQIATLVSTTDGHTSSITQLSNSIALKVSSSDYTASVIVSLINGSSVTIDADNINLNGITTMTGLTRINERLEIGALTTDGIIVIRDQMIISSNGYVMDIGTTGYGYVNVISPDLKLNNTSVATQTWVGNQDYATESYVGNQGFATQTWVGNQDYATESFVTSQGYASYNWVDNWYSLKTHDHDGVYCKNMSSQNLRFQYYNGYFEIWDGSTYIGKCDII